MIVDQEALDREAERVAVSARGTQPVAGGLAVDLVACPLQWVAHSMATHVAGADHESRGRKEHPRTTDSVTP